MRFFEQVTRNLHMAMLDSKRHRTLMVVAVFNIDFGAMLLDELTHHGQVVRKNRPKNRPLAISTARVGISTFAEQVVDHLAMVAVGGPHQR